MTQLFVLGILTPFSICLFQHSEEHAASIFRVSDGVKTQKNIWATPTMRAQKLTAVVQLQSHHEIRWKDKPEKV